MCPYEGSEAYQSNRDAALNEHMATVVQFGTQRLAAEVPAFVEFCKCKGVEHPITSMSFGLRLSDRVLHKKQNNRTRVAMYLGLALSQTAWRR